MFGMVPFDQYDVDLYRSFDQFARDFFRQNNAELPAFRADIIDQGSSYLLEAELPGFNKSDITVDIKDNVMTIKATHSDNQSVSGNNSGTYIRRERQTGSFARSFDITGIDESGISAAYENGVLKLTLPKKQAVVPGTKKIEIVG